MLTEEMGNKYLSDRAASLQALNRFSAHLPAYSQRRNVVEAGHPHVSRLSEAVKARLISEYEVASGILQQHAFKRAEKYVQEVYWRLYWKGWLEWHPEVWTEYRSELSQVRDMLTEEQRRLYTVVQQGESGVKIMDRFAQELVETGYLHNHARMWFAGYWIHVCGLPWHLGADFFYRHLLDADPASNTLSWRWVAGLQTQGKNYLPHAGNIRKYCCYPEAADPMLDEQLRRKSDKPEAGYQRAKRLDHWQQTQVPEIDEPYLLWIHGDDLSFWEQQQNMPQHQPVAGVMVQDENLTEEFAISELRSQFMRDVFTDARCRFESMSGLEVRWRFGSLVKEIIQEVKANEVAVVAGMLPAVGPLRSLLPKMQHELKQYGIRLVLWRRPEDEQVLPWAAKGFFPFWKSIQAEFLSS
ncbi:MAG: FAD-binding domain-containing protein [Verrucomicrobiota bacterium]